MSDSGTSERDRLRHFLDQQRNAVLAIVEGLDEAQLHTPVLPSGWTPVGLVRHLAGAEAMWFQWVVVGTRPQLTWDDGIDDPPYDPEAPFTTGHSSAAVIEQYRRQCELSNEILQSRDLHAALLGEHGLDWPEEPITDVRWVVLHMIEETARHAGHLDAARELLDGATGPPVAALPIALIGWHRDLISPLTPDRRAMGRGADPSVRLAGTQPRDEPRWHSGAGPTAEGVRGWTSRWRLRSDQQQATTPAAGRVRR